MRKAIYCFVLLVFVFSSNVYANDSSIDLESNIESQDVNDDDKVPLNIFDDKFPTNYTKWTELELANKFIYAFEDYFDITIEQEEISIKGDGVGIILNPEELYPDGRGNSISISIGGNEIHILMQRRWRDMEEKEKFTVGLYQMISKGIDKERAENLFNSFQEEVDRYIDEGYPQSIMDNIGKNQVTGKQYTNDGEAFNLLHNNSNGIISNNAIYLLGIYNDDIDSLEDEGSYIFPINFEVKNTSKEKITEVNLENPRIAKENSRESSVEKPSDESSSEQTQESSSEESVAEKKNNEVSASKPFNPDDYGIYSYEEVMRDRNGMSGKSWTFYAEVLQYFEHDNDTAMALVYKDGNRDEIIMLQFLSLPEQRIVENDMLDVYGYSFGLTSYNTAIGSSKTVPEILVSKVLIQGIDY